MRQLIFPFAIKSFEEIDCINDKDKRKYLERILWHDLTYFIASNSWDCSNPLDHNNLTANESGERLIHLLDSCPYEDLKDSVLFQELTKKYEHYKW